MEQNICSSNRNSVTTQCPICKAQSMPKMRRRCKSETSDVSPISKRSPTVDNGKFIVLNSSGNRDFIKGIKTSEALSNSLRKPVFKTNSSLPIKQADYIISNNKTTPSLNTNGLNYYKQYTPKDSRASVTYQNGITKPTIIERSHTKPHNLSFNATKSYSNRSSTEYPHSKLHENNPAQVEKKDNAIYKRFCIDVDALRGTLKELKHSELQQHQFENYIRKTIQDSNKYKEKLLVNEQFKKESTSPTNKRTVASVEYPIHNKDSTIPYTSANIEMRHSPRTPMHSLYSYDIKTKNKLEYGVCETVEKTSPKPHSGHSSNITMPTRNLLDCSGDARRRRTRARSLTESRATVQQSPESITSTETCVHSDVFTFPKRTVELSPNMKGEKPNTYSSTKTQSGNVHAIKSIDSIEFLRPSVQDSEDEQAIRKVKKSIDDVRNTKSRKAELKNASEKTTKKFKNSNGSQEASQNCLISEEEVECLGEVSDIDVSDSESACADTDSSPSLTQSNENIIQLGSGKELKGCPFWPSLFPNVPPSISFANHSAQIATMPQPVYKILKWKLTNITPIVVRKTLVNSGFRLLRNSNDWMGTWGKHMKSPCFRVLRSHQKINHFPGTFQIGRKDRLWRNLHKCILKFGKREFGFIPRTYVLPQDLKILRQSWERYSEKEEKWIIKPPASARGAGIRVVQRWTQIPKRNPTIVQKYIARPLLINGSKFDLRLYVLVTSIHPLRIYLYPDGLARFASVQYNTDPSYLNDRYMHLTNYSINKLSETYKTNEDAKACNGHKWTISSLWKYFSSNGINVNGLWRALADLVVRTMVSGESSIQALSRINTSSRYNCYELFGIDVLLDADLKPWLLEVNISPSLHSASPLDLHVKGPLVQALFNTALYKIPARLSEADQDEILKLYNLQGPLCYEKKLYTTALSRQEKEKHLEFSSVEKRSVYLHTILENLMPDDVRHLIQAEDELARCAPLERIFPTYTSHRYMEYFETPRYYNRLFDAWEHRYNKRRDEGIALLRRLCEDNIHLQVPVSRSISKHRAGCRAPTRKRSRWTPMSPLRALQIHRRVRTASRSLSLRRKEMMTPNNIGDEVRQCMSETVLNSQT